MSLTKLTTTLCGTFTGTFNNVLSFPFSDPGSSIVPDAITLSNTFINHIDKLTNQQIKSRHEESSDIQAHEEVCVSFLESATHAYAVFLVKRARNALITIRIAILSYASNATEEKPIAQFL